MYIHIIIQSIQSCINIIIVVVSLLYYLLQRLLTQSNIYNMFHINILYTSFVILTLHHFIYLNHALVDNINSTTFPICAEPVFKGSSQSPDIYSTVYNCIDNITDTLMPPRYSIIYI